VIFMLRAANSIADSKHADQPAAKSCSGLVPVPGVPGGGNILLKLGRALPAP
jgi:hypothetical protein